MTALAAAGAGVAGPSRSQATHAAGLDPYTRTLDRRRLAHLLRRTTMGAHPSDVAIHVGKSAEQVVDTLLADATDPARLPLPPKPNWADIPMPDRKTSSSEAVKQFNQDNRDWLLAFRSDWMGWFHKGGLREKMTLFWHNHFVAGAEVYTLAAMAYRYVSLLREHALGGFKTMVAGIGKTPAMLVYLNGDKNVKDAPNENYARELLELFTMGPVDAQGQSNYSQTDVQQLARALTGWTVNYETHTAVFDVAEFDDGVKTILGRSGAYGYNDVVDLLFEERGDQIAWFVCAELYREFVHETLDPAVVAAMAELFKNSQFEIEPVVRALLTSAHFYETRFIGARIKSPIELIAGFMRDLGYAPPADMLRTFYEAAGELDQDLLDPPDVSGWPGYHTWLSTNSLPVRWSTTDDLLFAGRSGQPLDLVGWARSFAAPSDPFALAVAIAEHLLAVPLDELDLEESDEPFDGDLIGHPIPEGILTGPPVHVRALAKTFLNGVPWYEWALEESGSNAVLLNYVQLIAQFPEFNLA
ncbi:MAG: DUF1800 domain-containing protein [Rhodothermales bacterium]